VQKFKEMECNMCAKAISIHKKQTKEYLVLNELNKLPDHYILLQNVFLKLKYPVTHALSTEKLKGCQIDFVVIGPPGVFIIEAKEWDEYTFEEGVPYRETDKAGLCVYIKLKNVIQKRVPIYNIVTTATERPEIVYGMVKQLTLWHLTTFIYAQEDALTKSDIRKLRRFLKNT
jgi:hypothetical protein